MVLTKPSMGWNTWNTFGANINEELVKEMADIMVRDGYLAAGYDTLVVDDAWQADERSKGGHLVVDEKKFPSGIKALADYVHAKGLKFGLYSAAGVRTCCNKPGSFGYEFIDAQDFADWGVDYLKYDLCHFPGYAKREGAYLTMSMALKATGKDIVYSGAICGEGEAGKWMRSIGAHNYRATGDIIDNFSSIKFIADKADKEAHLCASGCYSDLDMLVVGMDGEGYVGKGGCSVEEYYTHFALWCFYNSPLMIGCDLRKISKENREILLNKGLIAINQDEECRFPYRNGESRYEQIIPDKRTLFKVLSNGKFAIGMFNFLDDEATMFAYLNDYGLPAYANKKIRLTNLRTGEVKIVKDCFCEVLAGHASSAFLGEFVNGDE